VIERLRDMRQWTPAAESDPGPLLDFIPAMTPRFRKPTHLRRLAESFERGATDPGSVREAHTYPIRFGKTTLFQHAIAWLLRKDPTRSILYLSYAHGFAAKQTGKAKDLADRAGVLLGRTRRRDEWTTRAGGLVKGTGIGGQITGEGFTDIIIDDPHKNRAEAESRIIREGVIEAAFSDVFTRTDPRGTNIWVSHARWHVNDLTGVLKRTPSSGFRAYNTPALDERGRSLASWLMTAKQLEDLRELLGPYGFASLLQGSPRPRGGTLFGSPTLADLREPRSYRIAIGIDLCRSTATRSDWNAAVVMRRDLEHGFLDILEAVRERGNLVVGAQSELVDVGFVRQVARLLHAYPGAELCMYAIQLEAALVRLLERELSDAMRREIRVHTYAIGGDKYLRAQPYAASWNKGLVRIPGRETIADGQEDAREEDRVGGWQHALVTEHGEFTGVKGQEDDQVDAAAAAHDHLAGEAKTSLDEAMRAAGRV
jgi:hypothetical protein